MDYVIGLGANLGSRRANLEAAIALLDAVARVTRVSRLYESAPVGPPQPHYLNAAVRVQSQLAAPDLLARLLDLEAMLGRTREAGQRWGPRLIDLDILWSREPFASAALAVPHAQLPARWFALAPLLDVAPELEPEYGAALARAGGRRPPLADRLRELDSAGPEPNEHAGELCVAGSGADREDALAAALSALGRQLGAGRACTASEAQVVLGKDASALGGGDALAGFVRHALQHAARGFGFAHATVCEASAERISGRLLGAEREAPVSVPTLIEVTPARDGGRERVVIRLAR